MHFFKQPRKDFSSALKTANPSQLFSWLLQFYTNACKDLNLNLESGASLSVNGPLQITEEAETVERFFVQKAAAVLSLRSSLSRGIEAFLLTSAQLKLIPATEYPSRLRYKLAWRVGNDDASWTLDGACPGENDLSLVALASLNDLLKHSDKAGTPTKRLRVGDLSLTTGLRDLLLEKSQLVSELLRQHESLQANLARELHDTILPDLFFLQRELSSGSAYSAKEVSLALKKIGGEIRGLCHSFSALDLSDLGLAHALQIMAQRAAERSLIEITVSWQAGDDQLPFDVSLQIYRIVQESLNNALKHSEASRVRISAEKAAEELSVSIEDNGIGFSPLTCKSRAEGGGLGLGLLRERSDLLSSMGYLSLLSIDSLPGSGTRIRLQVDTAASSVQEHKH